MSLDEVAARRVIGELARELGLDRPRGGRGRDHRRSTPTWPTPSARAPSRRASIRATTRWWRSAAPGPLHGAEVADMLGIPEVIVPPHPGITSAMGLLDHATCATTPSAPRSRSRGAADLARINADFAAMAKELAERIHRRRHRPRRTSPSSAAATCAMSARATSCKVPIPDGPIDDKVLAKVFETFHETASPRIRPSLRRLPDRDRQHAPGRRRPAPPRSPSRPPARPVASTRRGCARAPARSASTASSPTIPTDFYRRDLLPVGERIAGPAIILQMDFTTVVPPRHNFEADAARQPDHPEETHEHRPSPPARRQARPHRSDHRLVIQGALENIAVEMGYKLMRMSYSSIIRESEDFGAALVDAEGRRLCESAQIDAAAVRPDPRLCPRRPKTAGGARRCSSGRAT